jgi:hypothetical protein
MKNKYVVSVWVKSKDGDNDWNEEEVVDVVEGERIWIELFFNSKELIKYFEDEGIWDEINDNLGGEDYVWFNDYGVVYDFIDYFVLISEKDKYSSVVDDYYKWDENN